MTTDPEFERERVCYEQNYAQARSLNEQMNRVPVLAMTLTGGLWFGAGVTAGLFEEIRFALMLFAGFCNIALVLAVLRIRDVLESYLEKLEEFRKDSFASGRPSKPKVPILGSYSMISIYCALIIMASALSFIGAFGFYWPFHVPCWWGALALAVVFLLLYLGLFRRNKPVSVAKGA